MCNRYLKIHEEIRKIFSLFLQENVCCGYSLEAPQLGTSVEYPQHKFPWRNEKNINSSNALMYVTQCLIG